MMYVLIIKININSKTYIRYETIAFAVWLIYRRAVKRADTNVEIIGIEIGNRYVTKPQLNSRIRLFQRFVLLFVFFFHFSPIAKKIRFAVNAGTRLYENITTTLLSVVFRLHEIRMLRESSFRYINQIRFYFLSNSYFSQRFIPQFFSVLWFLVFNYLHLIIWKKARWHIMVMISKCAIFSYLNPIIWFFNPISETSFSQNLSKEISHAQISRDVPRICIRILPIIPLYHSINKSLAYCTYTAHTWAVFFASSSIRFRYL